MYPVVATAPVAQPEDDGGFTPDWVGQQEQRLGPLQSTDESRRHIQEMPSARPLPADDEEESEYRCSGGPWPVLQDNITVYYQGQILYITCTPCRQNGC